MNAPRWSFYALLVPPIDIMHRPCGLSLAHDADSPNCPCGLFCIRNGIARRGIPSVIRPPRRNGSLLHPTREYPFNA